MHVRPTLLCSALSLIIASFASPSQAETYARVCVAEVDAELKEMPLAEDSLPGPGKKLVVHLDASVECTALIVPLMEKDSRLANGWRPQVVLLPQWTEKTLPDPSSAWEWRKAGDSFALWIFFFKRDAADLARMQKLVTAMQRSSKLHDQVLTRQTQKLCDMLSSRMNGNTRIIQGPKANAPLVGGTTRRVDFPWRDYAQKVPLNDALEGELVVRHGR